MEDTCPQDDHPATWQAKQISPSDECCDLINNGLIINQNCNEFIPEFVRQTNDVFVEASQYCTNRRRIAPTPPAPTPPAPTPPASIIDLTNVDGQCQDNTERKNSVDYDSRTNCRSLDNIGDCIGRTGTIPEIDCIGYHTGEYYTCGELFNQCPDNQDVDCDGVENVLYQCKWTPYGVGRGRPDPITGDMTDESIASMFPTLRIR